MKRTALAALLALACLLCACGKQPGGTLEVYRVLRSDRQTSGELLRAETVPAPIRIDSVSAAVAAFNDAPQGEALENPLPEDAHIIGSMLERGTLTLEADRGYRSLSGMALTRANACIVLTFTALDGVDRVTLICSGSTVFSKLTPDDLVLTDTSGTEES